MMQNLLDAVTNNEHMKIEILDKNNNLVISVVTPFVLRVHEKLRQSSEVCTCSLCNIQRVNYFLKCICPNVFQIVFMNSKGPYDRLGCKIFSLWTNSFVGPLPLGVIVTTLDTAEAITKGLQMILELVPEASFGGRGKKGPSLFMIKEKNEAIRIALLNVLPATRLLFCQSHIVNGLRNLTTRREFGALASHQSYLLDLFKSLVYENEEEIFHKKVTEILNDEIGFFYPEFRDYLLGVLKTQMNWASCYRTDLITRGHDTIAAFHMPSLKVSGITYTMNLRNTKMWSE